MPHCVAIQAGKVVDVVQPTDITTCSYVLMSGLEVIAPWAPIFDIPTIAELATAFAIGVTIPLTGFIVAAAIRPMVHFFD